MEWRREGIEEERGVGKRQRDRRGIELDDREEEDGRRVRHKGRRKSGG